MNRDELITRAVQDIGVNCNRGLQSAIHLGYVGRHSYDQPPLVIAARDDGYHVLRVPYCACDKHEALAGFELALGKLMNPAEYEDVQWSEVLPTPYMSSYISRYKELGVAAQIVYLTWVISGAEGLELEYDERRCVVNTDAGPRGIDGGKILSSFEYPEIEPCNPKHVLCEFRPKVYASSKAFTAIAKSLGRQTYSTWQERLAGFVYKKELLELVYESILEREFKKNFIEPPKISEAQMAMCERAIYQAEDPYHKLYSILVPRWCKHHAFTQMFGKHKPNKEYDVEARTKMFNRFASFEFVPQKEKGKEQ